MHRLRTATTMLAALILGVSDLAGQASPDSAHHRNVCRLAAQVIQSGEPAPRRDWARDQITTCPGEIAPALVGAMSRLAGSTDTAILAQVYDLTFFVQSPDVFSEAIRVAGDPSASLPARALALRSLYWTISRHPASISMAGLMTYADSTAYGRCWVTGQGPHSWIVQAPLPADYRAQARALGARLRGRTSEPWVIRGIAACIAAYPR